MRIGVFGGTFDPPHLGHLILAEEAAWQLRLDRLLWVLTPDPPHKLGRPITALEVRLAMLRAATWDNPGFELSQVELNRPGPHYAVDTVRLLVEANPGSEIVYLMGGDSLRDLPAWHHPGEFINRCAGLGVMRRPGDEIDLEALDQRLPGLLVKVEFINAPLLEISASQIRHRAANGQPFRYFIPPAVYEIIVAHRLYQDLSN
jgi:nicotinate-nucleotide adenylyltransferase